MTPRGTFELCCVYIAQLMTHTAIHTLPFTLQLCYKPLGILQRIIKSQMVYISSRDKNYTTCILITVTKSGSVITSWFRLNSLSTELSFHKSRKNGSIIRSGFRLKVHLEWTSC